ncbi:GTP-dependent nucleic acid-binding protein engD [Rothia dentocariosa]|nr:GTP-dependent nucleic acid-binding protein engD [Rothia dentocariosa]
MVELSEEEAREMLEMSGQDESGLDKLARVGFSTLGLQTYLTAGPKESRAWTIYKGDTAPQAAGVIHSDFERGFIKAEVVSFDDLDAAGSMNEAKARGKVRMEGKDYIMATVMWLSSLQRLGERSEACQARGREVLYSGEGGQAAGLPSAGGGVRFSGGSWAG